MAHRDPKYTNSLTTSNVLVPKTTICPTSQIVSGRNHKFGLTFVDLQSYFVRFSSQRQKRLPDGCLASTDNVDIIGVTKCLCLLVEYSAVRL
jgi:hypothetical protein